MKYPNLRAIRYQLPYGSLTMIADDLGVSVKTVSDFFLRGWHRELTNDILAKSLEIIGSSGLDQDLMKELDDRKLTSSYPTVVRNRSKKNKIMDESLNDLTWEDLCEMDTYDLVDLIEDQDLNVVPEDCENDDDLRDAIAAELDI